MTPDQVRDILYEGARVLWPSITPKQFGDASRKVVASLPVNAVISLKDLNTGIYDELVKKLGKPGVSD